MEKEAKNFEGDQGRVYEGVQREKREGRDVIKI